jgi:hypothetical protein
MNILKGVEMQFDRRDVETARDELGARRETGLGESATRECHQSHAQLGATFEPSEFLYSASIHSVLRFN